MTRSPSSHSLLWSPAPAAPELASDDVHVWAASLDIPDELCSLLGCHLSEDERDRAARFVFERDRRRFVIARGVLRDVLGRYLALPPGEIAFDYSAAGKPYLAHALGARAIHFNLSHSGELALYAIARSPQLGIDVERLRVLDDMEKLARISFSPAEQAAWRRLPADQSQAAFFRCWTRKEAFIKATGAGLSQPLDQFDVTLAPDEPPGFLRIGEDLAEHLRWALWDLSPAPGYAAALAARGFGRRLSCWSWSEAP